jgi:ribonuclease-3
VADRDALLADLETRIGHAFRSRDLLEAAVTHRSWANEAGGASHYERMEFLGDAVLGLAAADWLFQRFASRAEGELSLRKSMLVSESALARYAETLGLGAALRLGAGEDRSGGRAKTSLLADVVEALFGAVYLDGGFEAARAVVRQYLESASEAPLEQPAMDPKTRLQEEVQARGWPLPAYAVIEESGPDHEKVFTVEVRVRGELAGRGIGRTKKGAEQAAAGGALGQLEGLSPAAPSAPQGVPPAGEPSAG